MSAARTAAQLRGDLVKTEQLLQDHAARIEALNERLDGLALAGSSKYSDVQEQLRRVEDALDAATRRKRALVKAIDEADESAKAAELAAAASAVEQARAVAADAAKGWDDALVSLADAYSRMKDAWTGSLDAARKLGKTGGSFKIDGAPYLDTLHCALSAMPGGSPLPGGLSGRRGDKRGLAEKLGLA